MPVVSPMTTDYTNVALGDVVGWAPTSDTFAYNFNYCDGGNQFLPPANGTIKPSGGDGNTAAIKGLLDGEYDALYIYADQLHNIINSKDPSVAGGFGTTFAYIHTGLDQWSINGTTLAISKRGSGLKQVLDPCIAAVQRPTPQGCSIPPTPYCTPHPSPREPHGNSKSPPSPPSRLRLCPPRATPWQSHSSFSPARASTHASPPLPCLACLQLVETQTYQDICTSHFPASRCINNPAASGPTLFYDNKMNERTDAYACADGYCTCSASSA